MRFHIESSSYYHYACTMPIYNYQHMICIMFMMMTCDVSSLQPGHYKKQILQNIMDINELELPKLKS